MAFPTEQTLTELVAPIAGAHALDVEKLRVNRAGAKSSVTVALDGDERPDLDLLESVSQEISAAFDGAEERGDIEFGGQGYTLEVGTPGIEHPLTRPRHWRRNRGRLVALTRDGHTEFGRIGALNEEESAVILIRRPEKGRKDVTIDTLRLAGIGSDTTAVVEIEFSQPSAAEAALADLSYEDALSKREENK
ncbi:ribosome maturation factor RimP [Corynebacterium sp. CCM 9185]|uniref:Ribosome maturation factor RimP n=1 Tax=Corynebacterium marambiense TaxID=2765364 RepID=A0ABS0VVA4_9CORY|nr:ribosome maturation factor RimP [Corynebacterium marambiense]MBI9000697.1 ribosome maturation factor RimP [Corynebacterium marambiense]MCK7663040.1 ribosome maturation factor RimP [Corynebacterium marambiense]